MSKQPVDASEENRKRDPDLVGAGIAMQRAAHKARERAWSMGLGVVVLKDGRVVELTRDMYVDE